MSMNTWYKSQSPITKLLINFVGWAVYWIAFNAVFNYFAGEDEHKKISEEILKAVWMGFWWTVFTCWKMIRSLFKRKAVVDD